MALLELLTVPNPRLKIPCKEVTEFDDEFKQHLKNMHETLDHLGGGGLASIQVGVDKKVFIIYFGGFSDNNEEKTDNLSVFINPEIYWYSEEKETRTEYCYSVPGVGVEVERPKEIKVRYIDENFNQRDEYFEGVKAVCIQHETDHLNGILTLDRVSKLRKQILLQKIKKFKKSRM